MFRQTLGLVIELHLKQLYKISGFSEKAIRRTGEGSDYSKVGESGSETMNFLIDAITDLKDNSNFKIRIILNSYYAMGSKSIKNQFEKILKNSPKFKLEFADSQGDLWFMLSDNVKNSDPIHILSSERKRGPTSIEDYYKINRLKNNIRFHYIGSSFEQYLEKIGGLVLRIQKETIIMFEESKATNISKQKHSKSNGEITIIKSDINRSNLTRELIKKFDAFENNNECQILLQKFKTKFVNHFTKSKTNDITPFLNTFNALITDHIRGGVKEKNKRFYFEENQYDDFVMYSLYKVFSK